MHYHRWQRHGDPLALGDKNPNKTIGCSIEGCPNKHAAKGMCTVHYNRVRRYGDPAVAKKRPNGAALKWLLEAIERQTDDCILWPSPSERRGYGSVHYLGRQRPAHVVALLLAGVEQTAPLVLHSCDVRRCVNPRHLRWGTQQQNVQEAYARGRMHCRCCPNSVNR